MTRLVLLLAALGAPVFASTYASGGVRSSVVTVCFVGSAPVSMQSRIQEVLNHIKEFEYHANVKFQYLGACPPSRPAGGKDFYDGDIRVALQGATGLSVPGWLGAQGTGPIPGAGCTAAGWSELQASGDPIFAQISGVSANEIWGVDTSGKTQRGINSSSGWTWTVVSSSLKQVSAASDGTVWGLDGTGKIYRYGGTSPSGTSTWTQVAGTLAQISAGSASNIWGVNSANEIYRWQSNAWNKIPGLLKQVSAASDGAVWGVNSINEVYRWNGSSWTKMTGSMASVSVANQYNAWSLDSSGAVRRWDTVGWPQVGGSMKQISMTNDAVVYAISSAGKAYRYGNEGWGSWSNFPNDLTANRPCLYNLKLGDDAGPKGKYLNHTLHEFGHALGLAHEHSRSDADQKACPAVGGGIATGLLTPYDNASVMHYAFPACSISGNYEYTGLSAYDRLGLHILYPEIGNVAEFAGTTVVETTQLLQLKSTWKLRGANMAAAASGFVWIVDGSVQSYGPELTALLGPGAHSFTLTHSDLLGRKYNYSGKITVMPPATYDQFVASSAAAAAALR